MKVCVEWGQIGNPVEGTDFAVFFPDALSPAIELSTGDPGWIVSSELVSNGNPANIGSLTTPDAQNYSVAIAKAQDAGSLTLQPTGDHFSTLTGQIDGDLTGQLIVQQNAAEGGHASFTIAGNAPGNITIPSMPNGGILDIQGEFAGHIGIPSMHGAKLVLRKTSGSIDIGNMEGSQILQFGQVTSTAVITIGNMSSVGSLGSETLFTLSSGNFDFDADGTIGVGPTSGAGPVTFDGSVLIKAKASSFALKSRRLQSARSFDRAASVRTHLCDRAG